MQTSAQSRRPRVRSHPSVAEEQRATVAFLEDSATHGGCAVERIDTHISHIFLAGDRAYKLKRAVRTNFLDFTTAEQRGAACRREIEINAVVAAGIYRRAVPVTRRGGALRIGGDGEAVDWLVEMRRFDRALEFDALADAGRLDLDLIERLADVVAEMHLKAPEAPDFGGARRVGATIRQIAEAIRASPQAGELGDALTEWRLRAESALASGAEQIDSRRRHGYVRRCHGDLHLGNICLFEGRPTPFDALEFNEEMASTDVLYDIAFTVMDLTERGLATLSNAFLNRYLSATRDYSGLSLLPLFVSMRAAVRALVAASRPVPDPHEPPAAQRLAFAVASLDRRPAPRLIAIGGLSGAGKSQTARRVAPSVGGGAGAVLLRSDVARKRLFDAPPEARLPDTAYAPEVSRRVYARLLRDAHQTLRAGWPAILDATFLSLADRRAAETLAARVRVDFDGLWLTCAPDELRRRVAARVGDASDADLAVLERQLADDPGPGGWTEVRSDAGDLDETVSRALAALGER